MCWHRPTRAEIEAQRTKRRNIKFILITSRKNVVNFITLIQHTVISSTDICLCILYGVWPCWMSTSNSISKYVSCLRNNFLLITLDCYTIFRPRFLPLFQGDPRAQLLGFAHKLWHQKQIWQDQQGYGHGLINILALWILSFSDLWSSCICLFFIAPLRMKKFTLIDFIEPISDFIVWTREAIKNPGPDRMKLCYIWKARFFFHKHCRPEFECHHDFILSISLASHQLAPWAR